MSETDEKILEKLEGQFPLDAQELVRKTYEDVIRSGHSVVVSDNGSLFRIDQKGQTKIKDIWHSSVVTKTWFKLR